ncbi:hypothetical protein EON65_40885 [archaeon]|nr:MAG: hypothetical protein EON65_40885 [archaeon]
MLHSFSLCEELHKPVKRTDKKLLNDLMKFIRFPVRERVQEPRHKCYVLMQAIITFLPDIKTGSSSPFLQCTGLSDKTRRALQDSGTYMVTDIFGSTLAQVTGRLGCTDAEAKVLIQFAASVQCCKLCASIDSLHDNKVKLIVSLVEKEKRVIALQAMSFHLLCYDVYTSRLLYYRYLPAGFQGGEYIFDKYPQDSLRVRILGSLVGADFTYGAAIPSAVPENQRKVRTTNVESTRKVVNDVGQLPAAELSGDESTSNGAGAIMPQSYPLVGNKKKNLDIRQPKQHSQQDYSDQDNRHYRGNMFEQYMCSNPTAQEQENVKQNVQVVLSKLSEGVEKVQAPMQQKEDDSFSLHQSQHSQHPNVSYVNPELGELQRLAASTFVPALNVSRLKPDILRRSYIHQDVTGRSGANIPVAIGYQARQPASNTSMSSSQAVQPIAPVQVRPSPVQPSLMNSSKRTFFDISSDNATLDSHVKENIAPRQITPVHTSTEEETSKLLARYGFDGASTSSSVDKRATQSFGKPVSTKQASSASTNRLQLTLPVEPTTSNTCAAKPPIPISANAAKATLSPQSVSVKRPRPVGTQPAAAMSQKLLQDFNAAFC